MKLLRAIYDVYLIVDQWRWKYVFFFFFFRAQAEGQAILDRYTKEADSYKYLISSSGLGLSINDFLSYLAVRALEDAANPMQINLDSPARTNWQS